MPPTPSQPVRIIRKPTAGTFVFCILLSLAIAIFFLFPKVKAYSAAKQANAASEQDLQSLKDEQGNLAKSYSALSTDQTDLSKVDLSLPDKPAMADIYALMESFAKAANMSVSSVQGVDSADIPANELDQAASVPAAPGLGTITINMQLTGSVNGFVQVLAATEQSLRLIDVQSIDITQQKGQTSQQFRIEFKTYYHQSQSIK